MASANRNRRSAAMIVCGVILGWLAVLGGVGTDSSVPALIAACDETIDTTDSFSMNCVPTVIPDTSDQLTEAEVASPGWNAGTGAPGSGVRR